VSVHSSDLSAYHQCPRLHWYRKHQRTPFKPYVVLSQNLNTALILKLNVEDYFRGYQGMDPHESIQALESHEWLFSARFEAFNLRVTIPGLHRTDEGYEVYFTTLGLLPRIEDAHRFNQVLWVLQQNKLHITKMHVMHLDKTYQRRNEFDLACYRISSTFSKPNGSIIGDILTVVQRKQQDYQGMISEVDQNQNLETPIPISLEACPNPVKCEYFNTCFSTQALDLDSLYYFHHQNRTKWLRSGLKSISELSNLDEDFSAMHYAQIKASQSKGVFVDQIGLNAWLSTLHKDPLCFIDFEWDTYAQPPYDGMHPFDVLVFQFSLHVLDNGQVQHYEYLGVDDCREAFVEALLHVIPKQGSILAFNAFGAETIRLKELAQQFPQHQDELLMMIDRFEDLALIFNNGTVYHQAMKGSYTLKRIHQAIAPQASYEQLVISHGMEAVYHYRSLDNEEDQVDVRNALLAYGKMDTLAMLDVYQWLVSLTQGGQDDA
jgi:hypothetical protein